MPRFVITVIALTLGCWPPWIDRAVSYASVGDTVADPEAGNLELDTQRRVAARPLTEEVEAADDESSHWNDEDNYCPGCSVPEGDDHEPDCEEAEEHD